MDDAGRDADAYGRSIGRVGEGAPALDDGRLSDKSLLDERSIEYDGLALVLLAAAFLSCSASIGWIISLATHKFDAGVVAAGGVVGGAVMAAWIAGYPRRVAAPAIAFVITGGALALIAFPRLGL